MSAPCPVCSLPLNSQTASPGGRDATGYDCPHCGSFVLAGSVVPSLPNLLLRHIDAAAKLSHAIRQAQSEATAPLLNSDTVNAILKRPLPRPREQADFLIRWLARNVPGPGEPIWIDYYNHGSVIGCKSPSGFELIVDHLFTSGLVTGVQSKTIAAGDRARATLSFEGWEYYERLKSGSAVYRKGFMAMKFGDAKLNKLLEEVFKPGAKRAGFDLFKLDDIPIAGLIDDRLRVEIQACDFLVADLTHDNLGAYWEAGYAEGLGKPVIYTCEKLKFDTAKTHFDTNHHLTIVWAADALELAGAALTATIRATLPHIARLYDSDV